MESKEEEAVLGLYPARSHAARTEEASHHHPEEQPQANPEPRMHLEAAGEVCGHQALAEEVSPCVIPPLHVSKRRRV